MTDGKQTLDDDTALTTDILLEAVQPLKDKGVRVISLGIGRGTTLLDLLTLASTDSDVYSATDFKELKGLVKELTASQCPGRAYIVLFVEDLRKHNVISCAICMRK